MYYCLYLAQKAGCIVKKLSILCSRQGLKNQAQTKACSNYCFVGCVDPTYARDKKVEHREHFNVSPNVADYILKRSHHISLNLPTTIDW